MKEKIDIYRKAVAGCTDPIGAYVHDQASTFTMAICAPTVEEARATARESFEWYPKAGARLIASVAEMQADRGEDLGTYAYAADLKQVADDGSLDFMDLEYLEGSGACVLGTPGPVHRDAASATRRPASTSSSASSTRTRSRTRP